MGPIAQLQMLRLRWRLILAVVLAGLAAGWITTPERPPPTQVINEFTATNTLITTGSTPGGTNNVQNLAFLATTGEVPQRVAAKLRHEGDPAVLASQVKATGNQQLNSIQIQATMADGQRAAELVNAFSEELRSYLEQQRRETQQKQVDDAMVLMQSLQSKVFEHDRMLASNPAQPDLLRAERDALVRQYGSAYDRLQQLQNLPPATSGLLELQRGTAVPVFRTVGFRPPANRLVRTAAAGGVGLVLGVGVALALGRLDTRIRSKDSAEAAFGLPVIAEIPAGAAGRRRYEVVTTKHPTSTIAASHRSLRASIALMKVLRPVTASNGEGSDRDQSPHGFLTYAPDTHTAGRDLDVLLMTTPHPGEEKTAVAVNLAASFAEVGKTVLFLGFDVSDGSLFRFFGVEPDDGIERLLRNGSATGLGDVARETEVRRVWLSTVDRRATPPVDLLASSRTLISRARQIADVVIVDAGPVLMTSEAAELVPAVDAILVVCADGRTTAEEARRTGELLARLGAPVLGVVLTAPRGTTTRRWKSGGRRPTAVQPMAAEPAVGGAAPAVAAPPIPDEPSPVVEEPTPAVSADPIAEEATSEPDAGLPGPAADTGPTLVPAVAPAEAAPDPLPVPAREAEGEMARVVTAANGATAAARKPRGRAATTRTKAATPGSKNGVGTTGARSRRAKAGVVSRPPRATRAEPAPASGVDAEPEPEPPWWPEEKST